ncbi:MAG: hypothetical protein ACRDU8_06710, partial [Egibacteraceae bacterium]
MPRIRFVLRAVLVLGGFLLLLGASPAAAQTADEPLVDVADGDAKVGQPDTTVTADVDTDDVVTTDGGGVRVNEPDVTVTAEVGGSEAGSPGSGGSTADEPVAGTSDGDVTVR